MRLLATSVLFVSLLVTPVFADHEKEITTKKGKRFTNCEVKGYDRHGVTFRHDHGFAKVAFADLPDRMRDRYKPKPKPKGGNHGKKRPAGFQVRNALPIASVDPAKGVAPGNKAFLVRHLPGHGSFAQGFHTRPTYSVGHRINARFRTNSLGDIIRFRLNGYSNISTEEAFPTDKRHVNRRTGTYDSLYRQHFHRHSATHYGHGTLNSAVIQAPAYLPYVRNIFPRQIGTFGAGPSGGSLVPTNRSGFSQSGVVAPSLVPARRR